MSISYYDASIPVFTRSLTALDAIIDKAVAHAERAGIEESYLVQARLIDDMRPFSAQIQMASDSAKGAAARLAGADIPSFADTETTFAELKGRIARTLDFLRSVDRAAVDAAPGREMVLKTPQQEVRFDAPTYLFGFALPNFFFHVTTGYAILRHKGVPIGKFDYLGKIF
jgi:hypothetical protein